MIMDIFNDGLMWISILGNQTRTLIFAVRRLINRMAYLVDELLRLERMALSVQQQMELTSK